MNPQKTKYNKTEFRKRIRKIFEDGINGQHEGLKFKDHFDLLKTEKHWLGYNLCLCELGIISQEEYADNISFISQYYNIFIKKEAPQ